MGNTGSQDKNVYISMLKAMLRARGCSIKQQQLLELLNVVKKICPWFPEDGEVNIEIWEKVGKQLKDCYVAGGPEKIPSSVFSLWFRIRDHLEPLPEGGWRNVAGDGGQIGERDQRLPIPLTPSAPPLPPPVPGATVPVGESPLVKVFPPKKEGELEEEAEREQRRQGWDDGV